MRKTLLAAIILSIQTNAYGAEFTGNNWGIVNSSRAGHIVLAVEPEDPAEKLMLQINFYYEHGMDEEAIRFCDEYLQTPTNNAQDYRNIGAIYFNLTPRAQTPKQANHFRRQSIICFQTYMQLEGVNLNTNYHDRIAMAYTEIGGSPLTSLSNQKKCALNAAKSFDQFFRIGALSYTADHYRAAASAYHNAIKHDDGSAKYWDKAASYWEMFFQSLGRRADTQEYEKAATSLFIAADKSETFEKEFLYYEKSKYYWEQYNQRPDKIDTLSNLRLRALTYYYNGIQTNSKTDFKMSAFYWNIFHDFPQAQPTLRDVGNILLMNKKAALHETNPTKLDEYNRRIEALMEKYDIYSTYQIGDIHVLVSKKEMESVRTQEELSIILESKAEESLAQEDIDTAEEKKEDVDIKEEVSAPQLTQTQKKKIKKAQKLAEASKATDATTPRELHTEKLDLPTLGPIQLESNTNEDEKSIADLIETLTPRKAAAAEGLTEELNANLKQTKEQKKQEQLLQRTKQRKELALATSSAAAQERHHTIDSLTVMQIKKAYQGDPYAQTRALSVLDDILALKQGANGRVIAQKLELLKKYFSVRKSQESDETVILGHNISEFFYHKIHTSGQDNSWKPGMITRLHRFVKDIKTTFNAIMES